MGTVLKVDEIIAAARQLTPEDRALLLRALIRNDGKPKHRITELRGLGKEIWQGIDAQDYINAERDSWQR